MYYNQVTQAAYEHLLRTGLDAYDHTYRPDTEQLVVWTTEHYPELKNAIALAANTYDTGHVTEVVTGLKCDAPTLTPGQQESLTQVMEAALGQSRDEIQANLERVASAAQAVVDACTTPLLDDDELIMPNVAPKLKAEVPTEGKRTEEYAELCSLVEEFGAHALEDFLLMQSREYIVAACGIHPHKAAGFSGHAALCKYAARLVEREANQ